MRPFSDHTHPRAPAVQVELLRRRTPAERVALAKRIRAGADAMATSRLRARYPADDERTRKLRLASLKYDAALLIAAYGWDPDKEGR